MECVCNLPPPSPRVKDRVFFIWLHYLNDLVIEEVEVALAHLSVGLLSERPISLRVLVCITR